jgi:hypothetical protein
MLLQIEMLVV